MSSYKGKGKAQAVQEIITTQVSPTPPSFQVSSLSPGPAPSSSKQTLSDVPPFSASDALTTPGSDSDPSSSSGTTLLESEKPHDQRAAAQQQLLQSARSVFDRATQFFADDHFEQLYSCLFAANDLESMLACRMFLSAHAKMYALKKRDIVRPDHQSYGLSSPSLGSSSNNTGPTRSFTALLCLEAQLQHFIPQFHLSFANPEHTRSMFECHGFMLASLIFVLISQATGTSPSTRGKGALDTSALPAEVRTTVALLRAQLKAVASLLYASYDLVHANTSASLVRSACSKFLQFWPPFRLKFTAQFQKPEGARSAPGPEAASGAKGAAAPSTARKDVVLERRLDAIQDLTAHLCLAMNADVDVVRFGGAKYRGAAQRAAANVKHYIASDQDGYGKRDNLACGIGCLNCGRTSMSLEEATQFKLCGSCGIASFCDAQCAKSNWSIHKRLCTGRQVVSDKGKGKDI